ncbi:MAG: tripartite tricarboxylate transporter substrate binding protein [Alphaproteobacteria bacterium]|nr:tripartite tricarboxylate transporter substrate binding protein [Alphaproteobacteria bacterium]
MNRRTMFAFGAALALGGAVATVPAAAQDWPSRPITLVVPFAAGGPTDILGRLAAQELSTALNQRVVVDNRPGAGGTIGSTIVARAAPDGYTLLLSNIASQGIAATAYRNIPYDSVAGFTHVGLVGKIPNALVVNASLPIRTLADYIAAAKASPGLTYATGGNGTSTHLSGELLKAMASIDIVHVPYRGAGPAMTDVVAGRVPALFNAVTGLGSFVGAGQLRVIAVTSATRSPVFPDVPTFAEAGIAGYDSTAWFAISGPAGMPAAITQRLNAALHAGMARPEVRAQLVTLGVTHEAMTPAALTAFVGAEVRKWGEVVRRINLEIQ